MEKNFNMGLLDSGQMLLPNGTLEQRIDGIQLYIYRHWPDFFVVARVLSLNTKALFTAVPVNWV